MQKSLRPPSEARKQAPEVCLVVFGAGREICPLCLNEMTVMAVQTSDCSTGHFVV